MACMSRAGREPGFKKQNQDNCFAFEKYITNEQSLFGAFDGHGPNGMPSSCSRLNSRAISCAAALDVTCNPLRVALQIYTKPKRHQLALQSNLHQLFQK